MTSAMTRTELLALPAAVDLTTAARALGLGRTKAQELARAGQWPTPLLRLGSAYRVPTAAILRLLEISPDNSVAGVCAPATASNHSVAAKAEETR